MLCRANLVRPDGSIHTLGSNTQNLRALAALANTPLTLTDLSGETLVVGFEQMEAQRAPLGGPWLEAWEVRYVFVES